MHRELHLALLSVFLLVLSTVAPRSVEAQVEGFRFIIPDVEAAAGGSIRLTVQGEHAEAAQGFSFAARYSQDKLTIDEVHLRETILESIETDFFQAKILPAEGIVVVGALIDAEPPFEGELIPNIGSPLDLFYIEATVAADASGDATLTLENGLASPPVDNIYSVRNRTVDIEELFEKRIPIAAADGGGQAVQFVRGDADLDGATNITDAVAILNFSFLAGFPLPCLVAADTNDDEVLDVSDPSYLLSHLFLGGPALPSPTGEPGPDPTPGDLGCASAPGFSDL